MVPRLHTCTLTVAFLCSGNTEEFKHEGFGVTREDFLAMKFDSSDQVYSWAYDLCNSNKL